jgi:SAM-dependent methyltransferase
VRSPFDDPQLYDWEYRRRRDDVRFYRTLADERGGPVLDLGCGTGRLMLPLLRDGHVVVGLDLSPAMLERAAARVRRLGPAGRRRALLLRADLRALPLGPRFAFAVAAFHTIQHCETDADLLRFFRGAAAALVPGGWLAFDAFAPTRRFLERRGRSGPTQFRHPRTGRPTLYSESHVVEPGPGGPSQPVLTMTFHYQPLDGRGRARGRCQRRLLRHRLVQPAEIQSLLRRAGLTLVATWGGFDGRPLTDAHHPSQDQTEQHVYLAQKPRALRPRALRQVASALERRRASKKHAPSKKIKTPDLPEK